MAVAHDAASESHTGTTASTSEASFTWEHDPVATPAAVWVITFVIGSGTELATSVTYEGVGLTAVSGGSAVDSAGEAGRTTLWFLGSGVPTADTATVVVNRTNNAGAMYAVCGTVTAAGDCEVTGIVLIEGDGSFAEVNVDDGSPGTDSLRIGGAYFGGNDPPAAGANSTALHSIDPGARTAATVCETTPGQGSRPVGMTSASDDRAGVFFAIREIASGTNYDETGRAVSVTSTITATDLLTVGELGRAVSIVSTIAETDQADFNDAPTISIAATVTGTDLQPGIDETGKLVSITATITATDVPTYVDNKIVSVASTVVATDRADFVQNVAASIAATILETDSFGTAEALLLSIAATVSATDSLTTLPWWKRFFVAPTGSSGLDSGSHTSVDEDPPWSDGDATTETVAGSASETSIYSGFDLSQSPGDKVGFAVWARMLGSNAAGFDVSIVLKQDTTTLWTSPTFTVNNTAFATYLIQVPNSAFSGDPDTDNMSLEFTVTNLAGVSANFQMSWLRLSKSPFTAAQQAQLPAALTGQDFVAYRGEDLGLLGCADAEELLVIPDASGNGLHQVHLSGTRATYDESENAIVAGGGRYVGSIGWDPTTEDAIRWATNFIAHARVNPSALTTDHVIFSTANSGEFADAGGLADKNLMAVQSAVDWVLMSGDGTGPAHKAGGTPVEDVWQRITEWVQVGGANEHMWEEDDASPVIDAESGSNPFTVWSFLLRENDQRPWVGSVSHLYLIDGTGVTEAEIDDARDEWVNGAGESLAISIASTVAATDSRGMTEALSVSVASTVAATDSQGFTEALIVSIASTVTATDSKGYTDALTVSIASTVSMTEQVTRNEALQIGIVSTVSMTEAVTRVESLLISIGSTVSITDVASFVDQPLVSINATITVQDEQQGSFNELGRLVVVNATVTVTDQVDSAESLNVSIVSSVAVTDLRSLIESLLVSIASTVTGTDDKGQVENVGVSIVSTIDGDDSLAVTEASLVTIASTISITDLLSEIEALLVSIGSTVKGTDQPSMSEALTILINATVYLVALIGPGGTLVLGEEPENVIISYERTGTVKGDRRPGLIRSHE